MLSLRHVLKFPPPLSQPLSGSVTQPEDKIIVFLQILVYWFERLEREEDGEMVSEEQLLFR